MKTTDIKIKLSGLSDIMFDRFIDYSTEKRPAEQKLYLTDGNIVSLPSENIDSFLWGEYPQGCARKFEGKSGKNYTNIGLGHVFIKPGIIPFTVKGKPINFEKFDGKKFRIYERGGRQRKGSLSIKSEAKPRPVLCLPWELEFELSVVQNPLIDSTKLLNWFKAGGVMLGLGTYRPKYGRFEVVNWEEI